MGKKILSFLVVLVLAFACFTGCSCSNKQGTTTEQKQDVAVKILESGYEITEDGYMHGGIIIENPSQDTAYEFPKIISTAYDANGAVLATDTQTLNSIQPGERQAFGLFMSCNGQQPSRVEFTVESGNKKAPSDKAIKSSDLLISGANERTDKYNSAVTGMVKNNSQNNTKGIAITVLLRKEGQIVYGYTTFVDDLNAGQEKPFEASLHTKAEHDSFEVSALNWM